MKETLIVVPMKDPAFSKTRLRATLNDTERARLARLLYRRTLDMLCAAQQNCGFDLAVVTASDEAAYLAKQRQVAVIDETGPEDLSKAVGQAAVWACAQGYARMGIIPADLAAPDQADLARLLSSKATVSVSPSVDLGTNALLVSPPDVIGFHYGPGSARKHLRAGGAAGVDAVLMPLESLRFDIDTSDGLSRALETCPDLSDALGAA